MEPPAAADMEGTVRSVVRTLDILEIVCEAQQDLTIQEIAEQSGLAISTVHRLLRTLTVCGYLDQDGESRTYRPGLKIFELAQAIVQGLSLVEQARTTMNTLAERFNETVHLGVLDRNEVVYLDKRESRRPLRMYSAIGKRGPVYCTGIGKVLLAHLPVQELERFLGTAQLHRYTEMTITDTEHLRSHLATVRREGFALDNMEHEDSIRCIACPVFDHGGQVVAAISVTVPAYRVSLDELLGMLPEVKAQTDKLSRQMGYVHSQEVPS